MNKKTGSLTFILFILIIAGTYGQEVILPLSGNPVAKNYYDSKPTVRKSALADTLDLPFIDDFSYYLVEPDPEIWADRHAFINRNYALDPVTIGVATMDAIDYDGSLYPNAVTAPNSYDADHLTSRPINLAYPPEDSIYLSFYFQPQGLGDIPEPMDSLSVQFYDIQEEKWITVWHVPGDSVRPFKIVMIPIKDQRFLQKGFRFRFKNIASLSRSNDYPDFRGNVDHWNIDYVKLDRLRTINDTINRDVSFITDVPSILKGMQAIPWNQFESAYNTIVKANLALRYRNNDSITRNVTRKLFIEDLIYNESYSPGQPTAQDLPAFSDTSVAFSYIYPFEFNRGEKGLFKFTASLRTDEFDNKKNDTVSRTQVFSNYFAYDDGSAEFGYGLRGQGSKDGKVALKYNIYEPDQLGGVETYFNQIYDSINLDYYFRFVVWNDDDGQPGSIIYEDEKARKPVYADSINGLVRFRFDNPVPVEGVIYVGWRQVNEYLLNVGLDINSKPADPVLYYSIGDGWKPSNAPGIIMLRPYLYSESDGILQRSPGSINIFPNPAFNTVRFEIGYDEKYVEIFDLGGRLVINRTVTGNEINVSDLDEGIYIIRLKTSNEIFTAKLLISR